MIKIRLARRGRKKRPFYSIVAANSRSPRDGKFLEKIGYFDPFATEMSKNKVEVELLKKWLSQGAQMTDTVKSLVSRMNLLQGE